MSANTGDMGFFRAGQPYRFLSRGSTGDMGFFRAGRPFRGLIGDPGSVYTVTASGGVQSGGEAVPSVIVTTGGWPLVGGGPTRNVLLKEWGPVMGHLGDFGVGQSASTKFQTSASDGTPTALSTGAAAVYKTGSTTQSTTGVTLTADYDSVTGLNSIVVDTSADAAFYAPGNEFQIVLTAGTVDGVSVAGAAIASFSVRNRPEPIKSSAVVTSGIKSAGG